MTKHFVRFLLIIVVSLGIIDSAHAQGTNGGIQYASDFNRWSLPQGSSPASGQITWTSSGICTVTSNGYTFPALKVGRPVTIVDNNPANTETVTPTFVSMAGGSCTMQAVMAHVHYTYWVQSGTGGLQEALDYQPGTSNTLVYLTPRWTNAGGTTSMITSAHGNSNIYIFDQRTSQLGAYQWNGSTYILSPFIFSVATNLLGGVAGSVPCQTSTNITSFASPNTTTTNKFLTQSGNGTVANCPIWNTLSANDVSAAGLLSNSTTGNALTSTTATHAQNLPADLASQSATSPNTVQFTQVDDKVIAGNYASLNAAAASCPLGGGCTIEINSPISLSAGLTLPATTTLVFNQPGSINQSIFTLTINGTINSNGSPYQIFTGAGAVTLPGMVYVYPEWWGAKADANCSGTTGTDNTTLIQAAVNSLTQGIVRLLPGCYKTTNTINITNSNIGVSGFNGGWGISGTVGDSTILLDSATADVLDITGSTFNSFGVGMANWNKFSNFTVARSVVPSGTAAGIREINTGGVDIDHVASCDSIYGFYLLGTPQYFSGGIKYSYANWGYRNLSYTGVSVYGFYINTTSGSQRPQSTWLFSSGAASNLSPGVTSYAFYETGAGLQDVISDFFQAANTSYGIYVDCSGATAAGLNCTDQHFMDVSLDGMYVSTIYIKNAVTAANASIQFVGGWVTAGNAGGSGKTIDIESSAGVQIVGMLIHGDGGEGIYVANSHDINIVGNYIFNSPLDGIRFEATNTSTISGNSIINDPNGGNNGIWLNGASTFNSVTGNTIAGTLAFGLNLSIPTTNNIDSPNSIDVIGGGNPISDLGTSNGFQVPINGNASVSISSVNGAGIATRYNTSGVIQPATKIIQGTATLSGGTFSQTFANGFTSAGSYVCTATDSTAANAIKASNSSGATVVFTGTGTDSFGFNCIGN